MPAGWFGRETHPLLRSYCQHAATAEELARRLRAALAALDTREALALAERLSRIHAKAAARPSFTADRDTASSHHPDRDR